MLNSVFLDITKKLDNPDLTHSIITFVKTYENIKTDSAMATALSSFGKSLQTRARGYKRPTAVSRGVPSSGGPPKESRKEHTYGITERDSSAPHFIARCVEESICVEGTN